MLETFLPMLKLHKYNLFPSLILQFLDGPAVLRSVVTSMEDNLKRGNTIMPETFPMADTWDTTSVGEYLEWHRALCLVLPVSSRENLRHNRHPRKS